MAKLNLKTELLCFYKILRFERVLNNLAFQTGSSMPSWDLEQAIFLFSFSKRPLQEMELSVLDPQSKAQFCAWGGSGTVLNPTHQVPTPLPSRVDQKCVQTPSNVKTGPNRDYWPDRETYPTSGEKSVPSPDSINAL